MRDATAMRRSVHDSNSFRMLAPGNPQQRRSQFFFTTQCEARRTDSSNSQSTTEAGGGTESYVSKVKGDGWEKLRIVSAESDCAQDTLTNLLTEACKMEREGALDLQFLFFSIMKHEAGQNVYKQPTYYSDYDTIVRDSIPYHTNRDDYCLHGTIAKMQLPEMMAPEAIVCHIFKGSTLIAVVCTLSEYDYKEAYSLM